ncbi:MAG: hypothetical protein QM729_21420 [Solirubrobacterales bacterium]
MSYPPNEGPPLDREEVAELAAGIIDLVVAPDERDSAETLRLALRTVLVALSSEDDESDLLMTELLEQMPLLEDEEPDHQLN